MSIKHISVYAAAVLLLLTSSCTKTESGTDSSTKEPETSETKGNESKGNTIENVLEGLNEKYGKVTTKEVFCPFIRDDYYPFVTEPDTNMSGILCTELRDLDEDEIDEYLVILIKEGVNEDGRNSADLYAVVLDKTEDGIIVTDEALLSQNIMKGDYSTGFAAFIKESSSEGSLIGGTGFSLSTTLSNVRTTNVNVWKYKDGKMIQMLATEAEGSYAEPFGYENNPNVIKAKELGFESAYYWDPVTNYISSAEPDCTFLAACTAILERKTRMMLMEYPPEISYEELADINTGLKGELILHSNDFDDWFGNFR